MKIALLGYGKMGKTIAKLIETQYPQHEITVSVNSENSNKITVKQLAAADVAIEFSTPEAAYRNILKAFEANLPVVCGTTAWLSQLEDIKNLCKNENKTFFYASNFSIGVNIFFALNKKLAELMQWQDSYLLQIDEIHHTEKKDAPSGTGISLANDIIAIQKNKKKWLNKATESSEIVPIVSHREHDVKGTHLVAYRSSIDDIEIKHTAHSREGFAKGAITAAEWLQGKQGFFGMNDMLNL